MTQAEAMESRAEQAAPVSNKRVWAGRIISGLPVIFLLFDSVIKLMKIGPVVEGTTRLGYSPGVIIPLGIVLLSCTVL